MLIPEFVSMVKEVNGLEKRFVHGCLGKKSLPTSPCHVDKLWGKNSWLRAEAGGLFPQGSWETEEEKLLKSLTTHPPK